MGTLHLLIIVYLIADKHICHFHSKGVIFLYFLLMFIPEWTNGKVTFHRKFCESDVSDTQKTYIIVGFFL